MSLREYLCKIHEVNWPSQIDYKEKISEILSDNGLDDDEKVPAWVERLFGMVLERSPGKFQFDRIGSDVGSAFLELHELLGWDVDDYGEGIEMKYPESGVQVFVSREALDENRRGCCECIVSVDP